MATNTVLVLFCLLICGKEVISQGLPDQIQQFLQKTFFDVREKVHDGVQEIADALAPPSYNSSKNKTSTSIPTEYPLYNVSDSTPFNNETYPASSTINSSQTSEIEEGLSTVSPVTESLTLERSNGVLLNEEYFLSTESVENLKQLCPQLKDMEDEAVAKGWRYYTPSGNCSKIGKKGPYCGTGMSFYIQEKGSINGTCACYSSNRMSVYHESTNACYFIFTQGYCAEGEWIDVTRDFQPVCTPHSCITAGKNLVRVKGQCAELNKPSEVCTGEKEVVKFSKNKRLPECGPLLQDNINVVILPCNPGNSLAIHGKCHVSDWEFGDDGTGEDDKNSKN